MQTVPHSIGLMNLSQVWAYKSNGFRLMLTLFAIICTGILPLGLVLYWYRHWWVIASKQQCTLEEAETVIVIDHYKVNFLLAQFATISPPGPPHHPVCEKSVSSTERRGQHGCAGDWRSRLSDDHRLQVYCALEVEDLSVSILSRSGGLVVRKIDISGMHKRLLSSRYLEI